jgi:hypothetical protein
MVSEIGMGSGLAAALLDRGWGRAPVAVFAQLNGADAGVIRYDFRCYFTTTNSLPEDEAPVIDAEPDAEEAVGSALIWGDGRRVDGLGLKLRLHPGRPCRADVAGKHGREAPGRLAGAPTFNYSMRRQNVV